MVEGFQYELAAYRIQSTGMALFFIYFSTVSGSFRKRYPFHIQSAIAPHPPPRPRPPPLRPPPLMNAVVVQDPSQLHPSKGYGFVEFVHHGQALAALRQMNNNPAFSGQARSEGASKGESSRLIVEFSVENHATLKLHQVRR